jgi:hypothetical protein
MDFSTGIIQGTPTVAGRWEFWPAVRDKTKGAAPYRGNGAWWTEFRESEGKTWSQSKKATMLVVLPLSTGKEFRLQCSFQGSNNNSRVIFEIDYDNSLVKVIGANGKIAGVYKSSIDSDLIGWNKMASTVLYANSGTLDRKTGQLTIRYLDGSTGTANCEKRSETQKF